MTKLEMIEDLELLMKMGEKRYEEKIDGYSTSSCYPQEQTWVQACTSMNEEYKYMIQDLIGDIVASLSPEETYVYSYLDEDVGSGSVGEYGLVHFQNEVVIAIENIFYSHMDDTAKKMITKILGVKK